MIIQIYAMVSVEDAMDVAKAGADHIGFLVGREESTVISASLARGICRTVPEKKKVMMPICEDAGRFANCAAALSSKALGVVNGAQHLNDVNSNL